MGRHTLRIVMVVGVLVTLVGGTGIFAVFSDRAMTGPSDVTSGSLARAADINIAAAQPQDPMNSGPFMCDVFFDDLTTELFHFTATDGARDERYFCLDNAGSSDLDLAVTAIDVTDLDVDCTGDEAAFGDATCGLDGLMVPQAGELSPNLTVETDLYDCPSGEGLLMIGVPDFSSSLADLATTPTELSTLAPGTQLCVRLRVYWAASGDGAQVSQSDEATWRFAFDGSVVPN